MRADTQIRKELQKLDIKKWGTGQEYQMAEKHLK